MISALAIETKHSGAASETEQAARSSALPGSRGNARQPERKGDRKAKITSGRAQIREEKLSVIRWAA